MQQYALVDQGQIVQVEWFKRPELVPEGDWRAIGTLIPQFDSTTYKLGVQFLTILEDETVALTWTVVPIPPPPTRQRVTNAALEIALEQLGILEIVETFINQLPQKAPAVILWRKATEFRRSDALWDFFAPQLNMTSSDVDNLFNVAGQIDDSFNSTWQ